MEHGDSESVCDRWPCVSLGRRVEVEKETIQQRLSPKVLQPCSAFASLRFKWPFYMRSTVFNGSSGDEK